MHLKKHLLLLSFLFFAFVSSMAGIHIEADHSTNSDTLKIKNFAFNHISLTDSVVNYGKIFLNTPYHFGSPGIASFDCSGFTSHVYRNFGYNLEHSSAEQATQFDTIDRTQLKPGDLVFFSGSRRSKRVGHVGIVTVARENGEFDFIHAAVHSGVTISNSSEVYYTRRFIKATRVIGANQMLAISKYSSKSEDPVNDTFRPTPVVFPAQTIQKVIPAEYHRVKSGETLSSISKKYGMTVEEIKRKNRIKGSKLSLRQNIKIKDEETVMIVQAIQQKPDNAAAIVESSSKNNDQVKIDQNNAVAQNTNSHSVKKGETLFSISKIYNISIDELKNFNKIIKGKIHPGQQLTISHPVSLPKSETLAKVEETPKLSTHKVISGESLYSISKEYNVSIEELKKLNNIPNGKIHAGQEIKLNKEPEVNEQYVSAVRSDAKQESKIKETEKTITHRIKSGENLGSIAKENNTTVEELKRMNNLADSEIHAGQELKINQGVDTRNLNAITEKADNKKQIARIEDNGKIQTHVIKKGENLGSIAKANNTTVDELKRINNLADSKIHQGQELKLNQVRDDKKQHAVAEKSEDKTNGARIESNEKTLTHVIKMGENLGSIAKANNTTVDELKRINNLADSRIHQGQELKIKKSSEKITANSSKAENESKIIQHKVKSGESFYTIAKKYGCTVEDLKRWNRMTGSKIKTGDKLTINQLANN